MCEIFPIFSLRALETAARQPRTEMAAEVDREPALSGPYFMSRFRSTVEA